MTYRAIVAKVDSIEPIEGADRIVKASILGTYCIVSKDIKVGDIGILFGVDGCLSEEFAIQNKLYKRLGGYLEDNARIKCLKLKGVRSDGLFMPLSSIEYTGFSDIYLGMQFDELEGHKICSKYINPQTLRAMKQMMSGKKFKRGETEMFRKHVDTEQLFYYINDIKKGSTLIITAKLHGTSQRYGYVLDYKKPNWIQKLFNIVPSKEWVEMAGTRNVIITDNNRDTGFHDPDFRDRACEPFKGKLHKGEVVYYEVVGYEGAVTPIMGEVSIDQLDDEEKELYKNNIGVRSNGKLVYNYGCNPGKFDIYVYRIVLTNEDGHSIDYSWNDVKKRCSQLGVKHVPELEIIHNYKPTRNKDIGTIVKAKYESQPDYIDPNHPLEGVCVRVESGLDVKIYKYKTYVFKLLEGLIKSQDNYVDTEESS